MSPSQAVADSDLVTLCTPTQEYAGRIITRGDERNWPINSDQVLDACRQLRPLSRLDPLVSLELWLLDLPNTFKELWQWAEDEWEAHGGGTGLLDSEFSLEPEQLRWLHNGRGQQVVGETPAGAAIRPVSLDLTTGLGLSVQHMRRMQSSSLLAGQEVLVWLALNPQLVPRMGSLLPHGLWLPAFESRPTSVREWDNVPIIRRGEKLEQQLIGQAGWVKANDSAYAVALRNQVGEWC